GGLRACCLRATFRDRQIAVQLTNDLTHRGGKRSRFARSAQRELHLADYFAFLLPRGVKQRLDLFALAHVFGVGDDTNDLDFAHVNSDTLAERVIVGKKLASEGLIGNGDIGRAQVLDRKSTRLNSSHQIISYA